MVQVRELKEQKRVEVDYFGGIWWDLEEFFSECEFWVVS